MNGHINESMVREKGRKGASRAKYKVQEYIYIYIFGKRERGKA